MLGDTITKWVVTKLKTNEFYSFIIKEVCVCLKDWEDTTKDTTRGYFKDDKKRGFNHVKEISKLLNLEVIDCLEKVKNYKQSDQKMNERYHIQNVIRIDKTKLKGVKRVLIVDDVTTSLSTLKTIIRLLPTNIDIKILVLASNCRFVENKKI